MPLHQIAFVADAYQDSIIDAYLKQATDKFYPYNRFFIMLYILSFVLIFFVLGIVLWKASIRYFCNIASEPTDTCHTCSSIVRKTKAVYIYTSWDGRPVCLCRTCWNIRLWPEKTFKQADETLTK